MTELRCACLAFWRPWLFWASLEWRIKARARALDRVTEKALKRSSLAEDRKEQLNKAYKQHRERQRELERARERDRGLGFEF